MAIYLGILLFSFFITGVILVPFIDFLYRLHFVHSRNSSENSVPVGGGILIVSLVTFLYAFLFPVISRFGIYITTVFSLKEELNIIFFTFVSFALLGLYDDIIETFKVKTPLGSSFARVNKLLIQLVLSVVVAVMLFQNLKIDIINIPSYGVLELGWLFIPLATLIILIFSQSLVATGNLDGLTTGLLTICLMAFWAVSVSNLDTTLSVFIALWVGSLIAFLYFNVYPARIRLGRSGSLSFGASLAVTGLLLGKTAALIVIGGLFLVELFTQVAQLVHQLLFKNSQPKILPLHEYFHTRGWPEPKIVLRGWLVGIILAIFGLWLAGI